MKRIDDALARLDENLREHHAHEPIAFDEFLKMVTAQPARLIRNVFQVFHDMMHYYVGEPQDEYPNDPESIHFIHYDFENLFVKESDRPFFADRLFANRLMDLAAAFKRGAQQNKIYIFEGPPGCGKSTFLNNLLNRFEHFTRTESGRRYEVVWRLDWKMLCNSGDQSPQSFSFDKLFEHISNPVVQEETGVFSENGDNEEKELVEKIAEACGEDGKLLLTDQYIEVPCPSHDHPILIIPKKYRRNFFDDLFANDEFKWKLFTEKEYDWVFKDSACTICNSIYWSLLNRLKSPKQVLDMMYVRPYHFNRRMGQGTSVFNPGDRPMRQQVMTNLMLQKRINALFRDSNQVKYLFSRYAKTNNGIYALMDIKSHNIERLIELHNIISEGVHKVEDIEENVNSLLIALMNPEDKKNISDIHSFSDRIEYIRIPYVLDLNTEVAIYRNIFGRHIDDHFLPRVLHNFARIVISTRLRARSSALLEWIDDAERYKRYCDKNLQLLKMEIYTGHIPPWLLDEDRKNFTSKRRLKIIAEGEKEGVQGFSGRDSIKIFNEFYSNYSKEDQLITMSMLCNFFSKTRPDLARSIPEGFLSSLLGMYDYSILQEVKESLYYYNEEQISRELKNYLFAINFEPGSIVTSKFTGDRLEITDEFLKGIESRILSPAEKETRRKEFRSDVQKQYTSRTLTQEIMVAGVDITETDLYQDLHERMLFNLKAKVLEPFLENENFRQAIKDFDQEAFKTHDQRIQDDVTFLISNLCSKYDYSQQGAKEVCIYVIDNDLPQRFKES